MRRPIDPPITITGDRASAQTLRNTYAALLIEGGATDEHLNDFLGLQASVTAKRLREAYMQSIYRNRRDTDASTSTDEA